jgi:hypothetical protein
LNRGKTTSCQEGTWKVKLQTACTVTKNRNGQKTSSVQRSEKEYDVRYAGEKRGYRLSPLAKIISPSDVGTRICTWSLSGVYPGASQIAEGSWTAPAKTQK